MRWLPLLLIACHAASPSAPVTGSEVRVDRRVELVAIVMRLAGAEEYTQAVDAPYTQDVDAAFRPFASHPAIAMTKQLRESHEIAFDAPMHLAIHLDDQLQPRALPDLVANDERWRGVDVAAYAAQLRDFARAAKLDAFMAAHAAYYRRVEAAFRTRIDAENPRAWFDATFGARAGARFVVVPGLLDGGSNYGPHVTLDGAVEMYQVLGVHTLDAAGLPEITGDTIATLIHEMAHSYVNPVFDRHQAELARAGGVLYPLVAKLMEEQAYGDARTMFDESGVRAVTALYLRDRHGPAAGADAEADEVRSGFVWTPELARVLDRFRKDHAKYPTLEAFMPEVVAFFDDVAARYAHGLPPQPFLGPINAAVEHAALVPPTTKDAKLVAYVEMIRTKFFAGAGGANIVAYGSPGSNPQVQRVLAQSGIQLAADRITLGTKTFTGPNLVLIACWPLTRETGAVIYTAASDADIVGINSVYHGGTDWVVARRGDKGFETLGMGDFRHALDGVWKLP